MTDFYLMENLLPAIKLDFVREVIQKPFSARDLYKALDVDQMSGAKVMIIEQDAHVRNFLELALGEKGLRPYSFSGPTEAIDNYPKISPDIVIADNDFNEEVQGLSVIMAMKVYDALKAWQN